MKVGVLLKVGDSVYLAINNPKYIAAKSKITTYDYIYDQVHKKEDPSKTASHAIGDQTGYYISDDRIRESHKVFSTFDNEYLFVVELTEEEDQVIDNIADIMHSDYRTMPNTVPIITLEKVPISDLKEYLKHECQTIGERQLTLRSRSTLMMAFNC